MPSKRSRLLFYKFFSTLGLLSIFLIVFVSIAKADFIEDFDEGYLSLDTWIIDRDSSTQFIDSYLSLINDTSKSFPYIRTKNSIIDESFTEIKVRFKYNSLGGFGNGLAITDVNPPLNMVMTYPTNFRNYSIFYVWQNSISPYLHIVSFLCNKGNQMCIDGNPIRIYQTLNVDTNWHELKIGQTTNSYQLYLDDVLIFETNNKSRIIKNFWFGHPETTLTSNSWSSFNIDYFRVKDSTTFPYYSQKDERWREMEYDHASLWADEESSDIERWGCALSSASMILEHYQIKDPSGAIATPDILNDWLKQQSDGYVGSGLLNWLAISRYARESYEQGQANTKLEFSRGSGIPTTLPSIINEGSHFVVAHASQSASLAINDPNDATRSAKALTESFVTHNDFIPSMTDLSYFMLAGDVGYSAIITDESGNIIPIDWQDESIGSTTSRIGLVSKPASGKYQLSITRDDVYFVDLYMYDQLGEFLNEKLDLPLSSNYFDINFDKNDFNRGTITTLDLTPPPSPTLLTPISGAHANTGGLILDWSDVSDVSTPVTYKYKSTWNGGNYGPINTGVNSYIRAEGSPENTYQWYVQACDAVENCSDWSEPSTLIVDNTSPNVDLIFPNPGMNSKYFEVVFSELVNPIEATNGANYYLSNWPGTEGSGDLVDDVRIDWNNTNKTAKINFLNTGWYVSPEQKWGVRDIHDLAGNLMDPSDYSEYSTEMIAPVLDSPPRTISPINSLTQVWNWIAASDDGSGIGGYSTRTYDVINDIFTEWNWLGNVLGTNTGLSEGDWLLELKANDLAGNESEILKSTLIKIDLTRPTLKLMAWGSTIDGTASDNLSGIARIEIKIRKPDESEETVIATGKNNWTYTMSEAPLGNYQINVWAWDEAGNKSEEVQKEFVMSNPTVESPVVLGVSTYASLSPSPKPKNIFVDELVRLKDEESVLNPNVLGVETNSKKKINNYWWWVLIIVMTSLAVYFVARKRRN